MAVNEWSGESRWLAQHLREGLSDLRFTAAMRQAVLARVRVPGRRRRRGWLAGGSLVAAAVAGLAIWHAGVGPLALPQAEVAVRGAGQAEALPQLSLGGAPAAPEALPQLSPGGALAAPEAPSPGETKFRSSATAMSLAPDEETAAYAALASPARLKALHREAELVMLAEVAAITAEGLVLSPRQALAGDMPGEDVSVSWPPDGVEPERGAAVVVFLQHAEAAADAAADAAAEAWRRPVFWQLVGGLDGLLEVEGDPQEFVRLLAP